MFKMNCLNFIRTLSKLHIINKSYPYNENHKDIKRFMREREKDVFIWGVE